MTLFPDRLENWIVEDNRLRVVDRIVDEMDLGAGLWAYGSGADGPVIRRTCAQFVKFCRRIGVFFAIDGSKFKAANSEAPNATGPSERAERQDLHQGQGVPDHPPSDRSKQRLPSSGWEHEHPVEAMHGRMDSDPALLGLRHANVEPPFGKINTWMGLTLFRMRTLKTVRTEMAVHDRA